ncbi:DoxX family membrane protein [Catenovulum sp. SM1970]|uniref:DoxX family membrane protein n=1 Tax=Marinifaba aquimaris TaxID=2741323 RepID=UPI001574AB5E|nr:DoxX family membrane protein [Marinifaba aquimaris]NTS75924.1 DoxX family membrane protein [Marinifaba aquimaris]
MSAKRYALPVLATGFGLQLMSLGFRNKLFEPGATMLFLEQHPYYNFVQLMGFTSFEHIHFVYSTGLFEVVFGLALVLGLATRFVCATLWSVFIAASLVSGLEEVIGHLPIFGILVLLTFNPPQPLYKLLMSKYRQPIATEVKA